MHQFSQIYNRVMALEYCQNFVSAQYHVNESMEIIRFYVCIDLKQILVGIVTRQFSQIYNSVMALDFLKNFVSTQYLANQLMEFDQILHALTLTRSILGLVRV